MSPSNRLSEAEILDELRAMYRRRGDGAVIEPATALREINFRSLDFSELALRLEDRIGGEINFAGTQLRRIETVQDVLDFFGRVLLTE
jgi:acyl carrier protein